MLYLHEPAALCDSVLRGAVWPEAIGTFIESGLADRLQHLQNALLHNAVHNGGDAQRSELTVRFWDFHPPDRAGMIPTELFLDKPDECPLAHFGQVLDRPLIHAGSTASLIALDRSVSQPDIFFACNQLHQVLKYFALQAVCVQAVKGALQVVILRIADFTLFWFVCLLPRSQHRHPLLSGWIFFVILEAVFIMFSVSTYFRLGAFSPQPCYCCFTDTMPLLSLELRAVVSGLPEFPAQRPATVCFIRSQLSTFRQSYLEILLGAPSKPVPSSKEPCRL